MLKTAALRAAAFLFILLLGLPVMLAAQDEGGDPEFETDWDDYSTDLYTAGDQTFMISLGVLFPTVFVNDGDVWTTPEQHKFDPPVGGTGSLAFNYYVTSNIFVGGEVGGMFSPTIAKNTVFTILLGARGGYQFNIWKLEFPISVAIGMIWQTYLDKRYYGLYLKGGLSAYFRASADWSFGLASNWYYMPQRTGDSKKDVDGNFVDLLISARYHF